MYLYGASGHAKVIADILESQGKQLTGIIDDNVAINELMGYPVFHKLGNPTPIIVSIGDNKDRRKVAENLLDFKFETAIHTSAVVSPQAAIGDGTVVMQCAIVQAASIIGRHCIVNTGASVDHDCVLGDYVHVSPHATLCGNVIVGEGTWIGAGTVVIPGIKIGKWSVVGAGSVVTKDIPDNVVAAGNPCKIIKYDSAKTNSCKLH